MCTGTRKATRGRCAFEASKLGARAHSPNHGIRGGCGGNIERLRRRGGGGGGGGLSSDKPGGLL